MGILARDKASVTYLRDYRLPVTGEADIDRMLQTDFVSSFSKAVSRSGCMPDATKGLVTDRQTDHLGS
jgi:hypothetical protein